MDIGSILLATALTVVVGAFIAKPLFDGVGVRITEEDRELSALYAERERVMAALEELEMDLAMGKLLPEDYQPQRTDLMRVGSRVLKRLDEMRLDTGLELALDDPEAALEAEIARLRRARGGSAAGLCGTCGGELLAGDSFCARCGSPAPSREREA